MSRRAVRSAGRGGVELRAAGFDLAPWPALIVGADGALLAANEAAEALFGQGLSLLARGRFEEALPADNALVELLRRAREENALVREPSVGVSLFGHPPFLADGAAAPLGEGAVMLTLTPKPLLDRRADVQDSPALAGLSRMLAHEIKNPLQGIRGAAQLLKSGAAPEDASLAQLIVDETDRVSRLIDSMERLSDPAVSPSRDAVNLHVVLDRVRALAANGFGAGLVLKESFDPSLPPADGDEDQLIQVFLNLAKNAAEAAWSRSDGQGELTICTAYRHGVRTRGPDGRWRPVPLEVRIQDNGPGIDESLKAHLFEPFVTTKPNGAGLGLALVARLVAAHGGLIDFDSEPGRTTFRVLLPAAPL